MIHRALLAASALALLTTGCPSFQKANGAPFTPAEAPAGKAVVYFYRPPQKIMSDYAFFMSLPESADNCYRLESGGYTPFVSDPGQVTVAGKMINYKTLALDLKAGDERYVQVDIVDDDAVMREVPAGEAKGKIAGMRGIETCSKNDVKAK